MCLLRVQPAFEFSCLLAQFLERFLKFAALSGQRMQIALGAGDFLLDAFQLIRRVDALAFSVRGAGGRLVVACVAVVSISIATRSRAGTERCSSMGRVVGDKGRKEWVRFMCCLGWPPGTGIIL